MDKWRLANTAALTLLALWCWWMVTTLAPTFVITDAQSYWSVDLDNLYAQPVGERTAFLYSPLVAQVIAPFTSLPYGVFYALLLALNVGALVYLLRPIGALLSLAFPPIPLELAVGNIHLLLAAAIVFGMRHRGAWAVLPLTKITPYVVALYDWRSPGLVVRSLVPMIGLVALSALIAPNLWVEWIGRLLSPTAIPEGAALVTTPLWIRLALAVGMVLGAGWKRWPWLLPIAAMLALPVIWTNSLAMLVACWPLSRGARPWQASRTA